MCQMHSFVCFITLGLALPATVQRTGHHRRHRRPRHRLERRRVCPARPSPSRTSDTRDIRVVPTNEPATTCSTCCRSARYTVKIELQGFGPRRARVTLATGDRARVDAKLQLGTVAENVHGHRGIAAPADRHGDRRLADHREGGAGPAGERTQLHSSGSDRAGANEGLPNSLASGTRPDDRRQTSAISINGALDNQNNQLIDGIDNNERVIGTIGVKPSIDAIAEVKVQTNMYTAEVGRTAGGVVNIITKSGTNSFHGSAFEFDRNDKFDARNFFASTGPKPKLDRISSAAASAGRSVRTGRSSSPTTRASAGPGRHDRRDGADRARCGPAISPSSRSPSTIRRRRRGRRFRAIVIPAGRLDPIALQYMGALPAANRRRAREQLHRQRSNRTQDSETADFRVDHRFNDNSTLFVRYSYNNVDTFTPGALPAVNGIEPGGNDGPFPGPNTTKAHGVAGELRADLQPDADLRGQGGLHERRHPVTAAELRQEPQPGLRPSRTSTSTR